MSARRSISHGYVRVVVTQDKCILANGGGTRCNRSEVANLDIIRKVTPAGVVTTLSGTPVNLESLPVNTGSADGAANVASFNFGSSSSPDGPWGNPIYTVIGGLTAGLDGSGNFVFADTLNNLVRRVASDGSVTTIAGTAGASGSDDGAAAAAKFVSPGGVALDSSGNVFIADSGNNTIRRLAGA